MSTLVADEPTILIPTPKRGRVHLNHLDSIRALAAIVVLFHHAYGFAILTNIWQFPHIFRPIYNAFLYAHYAVDIFIVLSGYCLMIPVAKNPDMKLPRGFGDYIRRRAWRILPPYYAAIVVSILLIGAMDMVHKLGFATSEPAESFTARQVVEHVLLINNVTINHGPIFDINAAMWSIATEWQIYFIFPLLLLPIMRRFGMTASVLTSVAVFVIPFVFTDKWPALRQACPWYASLFAMGMSAAYINFSQKPSLDKIRKVFNWRWLPLVLGIVALVLFKLFSGSSNHPAEDTLLGLIFAAYLSWFAAAATGSVTQKLPGFWEFLEAKWLVNLGKFSYSVYLVHIPFLALLRTLIPHSHFSPTVQFVVIIPCEMVLAVGFAYLFHLGCERPFLNYRDRVKQAAPALAAGQA